MLENIRRCTFKMTVNQDGRAVLVSKDGLFHKWGDDFEENGDETLIPVSIAIIEDDDGKVHSVCPSHVEFHKPLKDVL